MPIYGDLVPTPEYPDQSGSRPVKVITADVPQLAGCPVLTRLKAYVMKLGEVPTLRYTFRDSSGAPVDISGYFTDTALNSMSEDEEETTSQLLLRIKEIVADGGPQNKVKQLSGRVYNAETGTVDFDLLEIHVAAAGIYQMSVCLSDQNNKTVTIENPVLWVERSLFPLDTSDTTFNQGPPTIDEVRMALMDSSRVENPLLDAMEFSNDQLTMAMVRPIHRWNQTPPPLRPLLDTRNFPYRDAWLSATSGHLLMMAAHNYRRNYLNTQAGGINVDDKAKEPNYMRMGQALLDEYDQFVRYKKIEINTQLFAGSVTSQYGSARR